MHSLVTCQLIFLLLWNFDRILALTSTRTAINYKNSNNTYVTSYPKPSPKCLNTTNDVSWNNGYVMSGTTNVYVTYITSKPGFYTSNSLQVTLLQSFITGLSLSPYAQLLTKFPQGTNTTVKGSDKFNYVGYAISPTAVTTLTDKDVAINLNKVIVTQKWPYDKKGLYIVIFSGEIQYTSATTGSGWNQPGGWCGFHMLTNVGGHSIQVLTVGDETGVTDSSEITQAACAGIYLGQLGAGSWNYKWTGAIADCTSSSYGCSFVAPNDKYVDAMISVVSHEIFETITNPNGKGWYRDCDGYEIGDICVFDYGHVQEDWTSEYSYVNYNLQFGSNYFLVQEEWNYRPGNGSFCALSTGSPTQNNPLFTMGEIAAIAFGCFIFTVGCILMCCYCRTHNGRPLKAKQELNKGAFNIESQSTKTVVEAEPASEQL